MSRRGDRARVIRRGRYLLPGSFRRRPGDVRRGRTAVVAESAWSRNRLPPQAHPVRHQPRLRQHSGERERGGTAHGRSVAELRGADLTSGPCTGEHTLVQDAAHVVDEPRGEWPEAAAEEDDLDVEQVDGRGEAD